MPIKDPEKRREAHRVYMRDVWYPKNKKKHIALVGKRTKKHGKVIREFILRAKAGGCTRCPENHPACLDFHHLDPTIKEFSISGQRGCSLETLQAEIAKCIVLCANCHRKEHADDEC